MKHSYPYMGIYILFKEAKLGRDTYFLNTYLFSIRFHHYGIPRQTTHKQVITLAHSSRSFNPWSLCPDALPLWLLHMSHMRMFMSWSASKNNQVKGKDQDSNILSRAMLTHFLSLDHSARGSGFSQEYHRLVKMPLIHRHPRFQVHFYLY